MEFKKIELKKFDLKKKLKFLLAYVTPTVPMSFLKKNSVSLVQPITFLFFSAGNS